MHFLQIWIIPDKRGVAPRYDQKTFPDAERRGRLRLVASGDGSDGSIMIHQDARVFASILAKGETVTHAPRAGRRTWIQAARGDIDVNGQRASAGDGLAIEAEASITVKGVGETAEFLLFDLP